jgi:hypothetical protein
MELKTGFRGVIWNHPPNANGIYRAVIGGVLASSAPIGTESQYIVNCSDSMRLFDWIKQNPNLLAANSSIYKLGTMNEVLEGLGEDGTVGLAIQQILER